MNRRVMRCLLVSLALLPVPSVCAQNIQTNITLTANPSAPIVGQPVTLTATMTVSSGSIAATNGLQVEFTTLSGNQYVALINGVATAVIYPNCNNLTHGCSTMAFATFPISGNFGPSQASLTIVAEEPGIFKGQYAFLFQGKAMLGGAPQAVATVGKLTFDGDGNVTGTGDINTGAGAFEQVPFTGSYTGIANATGIPAVESLTLHSSQGTQHFTLFVSYTSVALSMDPPVQKVTFIETDGSPVSGKGEMTLQTPSAFSGIGTQGAYVIDLVGETACEDCSSNGHDAGLVYLAGQLFVDYPPATTGGVLATETLGSTVVGPVQESGSFLAPDANGRTLFTLTTGGQTFPDQPTHFVAYAIDGSHFYVLSLDPHTEAMLLSGKALQQ